MKQHEREFFIYTIRSGKTFLSNGLVIHPPTIDQIIESLVKYNEAYEQAVVDGLMTENQMEAWMKEQLLWTSYNENKVEEMRKKIENLKVDIYEKRQDAKAAKWIRLSLRENEKILNLELSQKGTHFLNTCEGFATSEKTSWLISQTTYKNNKLYDFAEHFISQIVEDWYNSFLTDSQARELARNEPWKSLWVIKEKARIPLFMNVESGELTYNQKNLMVWSQMYDNIQESLECPSSDVINDDDMLDGWFILQNRKRDKERLEKEFEITTNNNKIKNSSEVFIMASNKDHAAKIQNLNSLNAKRKITSREKMIEAKGQVAAGEFIDEKIEIHNKKMSSISRQ
jgi:hypothetical protein